MSLHFVPFALPGGFIRALCLDRFVVGGFFCEESLFVRLRGSLAVFFPFACGVGRQRCWCDGGKEGDGPLPLYGEFVLGGVALICRSFRALGYFCQVEWDEDRVVVGRTEIFPLR